jgi:hypothetical protein
MPKAKATKGYIKKAKAAQKSTAQLHPDEMMMGGHWKYVNEKWKQFWKKQAVNKAG